MLDTNNSILVIIDIQEKLVKAASNGEKTIINTSKISQAAQILSIPVIITEQYPKGLGATVESITGSDAFIMEKSSFSAFKEPEFEQKIKSLNRKQVILCGIETHICVLQTAIDLYKNGYEVYVLKDCVSSRSEEEQNSGLELLKQYGIKVITVEIALFQWLKSSKHPQFKDIQKLII
jgi:nicotinamidase-related amidase